MSRDVPSEGTYPAQLFSHLKEFVIGYLCSYRLFVLNTVC